MPLNVNGLHQAEGKRNVYRINLAADVTADDLLSPDFWVHVSAQLRADDQIEVVAYDRAWFGVVMVLETAKGNKTGARVAYIGGPVALTNVAKVAVPEEHEVRWGGPNGQWQVVRIKDRTVYKGGISTKEEAVLVADGLKAA